MDNPESRIDVEERENKALFDVVRMKSDQKPIHLVEKVQSWMDGRMLTSEGGSLSY